LCNVKRYLVLFALALGLVAVGGSSAQAGWGFNLNFRGIIACPATTGTGYCAPQMWPGYTPGGGVYINGDGVPIAPQVAFGNGGYAPQGPAYAAAGGTGAGIAGWGVHAHMSGSFGHYGYPWDSYDQAFPDRGPAYPLGWDAAGVFTGPWGSSSGFSYGYGALGSRAYRP
jgi:hypothetical protein